MSNPPSNPPPSPDPGSPPPPPQRPQGPRQGPWIYSTGTPEIPGYYTPPTPKPVPAGTAPAPQGHAGPSVANATASPSGTHPSPPPAPAAPAPKPQPAGTASAKSPDKLQHSDASLAGVIDTIEAIIIALIIALTFRAFIVEAFVIPTGSMAPTLLGAHFNVICPKCGYEFDRETNLGAQALLDNGHLVIPARSQDQLESLELGPNKLVPCDDPVICPNCRFSISAKQLPQYLYEAEVLDNRHGKLPRPLPFVWANNGDRILVLKYLYSIKEPDHWDVGVFKEPRGAKANYIKRIIALPEETVQIINGDIFILPRGKTDAADHQISRKPEYIQQYLWQLVYDNDYYPRDEGDPRTDPNRPAWQWSNPWIPSPEADWVKSPLTPAGKPVLGPIMHFAGNGKGILRFNLRPDYAADAPYTLNTLGYNADFIQNLGEDYTPRSLVGDLRLELLWTPEKSDSTIALTLGRPNNCYQVRWNPADPHSLQLLRLNQENNQFQLVEDAGILESPPVLPGDTFHVALNNVDHAVQFYVNGRKLISYTPPWSAAQALDDVTHHAPDERNPDAQIQVDVSGTCTLAHLKLFRDLFYTAFRGGGNAVSKPLRLGPNEFFALGDNSRRSFDGRGWEDVYGPLGDLGLRPGIVPQRFLLGKAFFVYWPAGYRPSSSVPVLDQFPIVPDTGDMRIIR